MNQEIIRLSDERTKLIDQVRILQERIALLREENSKLARCLLDIQRAIAEHLQGEHR
jgi:hypothetical protein